MLALRSDNEREEARRSLFHFGSSRPARSSFFSPFVLFPRVPIFPAYYPVAEFPLLVFRESFA